MLTVKNLTSAQVAQLQKDPRIKELWATAQERELNVLERLILNQIVLETIEGK